MYLKLLILFLRFKKALEDVIDISDFQTGSRFQNNKAILIHDILIIKTKKSVA